MPPPDSAALRYHDGTKHSFDRFARSLGYLDWASQPAPFRSFSGAPRYALFPAPSAPAPPAPFAPVTYASLYDSAPGAATPLSLPMLGDLLRHALGLSAWKAVGTARWSLRVNPSSGNLHPTEAYVVCGPLAGASAAPAVYHYAPEDHVIEQRCEFDSADWSQLAIPSLVVIGLTSIHWRESWKYGERAFRYCQHDLGHAIAALALAARLHGWRAQLLPSWSHVNVAALLGLDRDEDFFEAEREEPGGLLALMPNDSVLPDNLRAGGERLAAAVGRGRWTGQASQLSEDHVEWSFLDAVAQATRDAGRSHEEWPAQTFGRRLAASSRESLDARAVMLQRRSAVGFDPRASMAAAGFFTILSRLMPDDCAPWTTMWWSPRLHLVLFVHRVEGVASGLYLLPREPESGRALRATIGMEATDEPAHPELPLVRLARGDCRTIARRLSCDQDIAADGFFSLAMIADVDRSLDRYGDPFYRQLFWEAGVVGQVLYLEAEAAGARGTGIGCYYDDGVHELLALRDRSFQSLYHFAVGRPVEDRRLRVEAGYAWERSPLSAAVTPLTAASSVDG